MATISKILGGHKAKNEGQAFERMFFHFCTYFDMAVTRVPDGCKQLRNQIIRVKSPWDWVVTYATSAALIDTKSTADKGFRHSAIDKNQVHQMLPHSNRGTRAGYVIWLRKEDAVIYVDSRELAKRIGIVGSIGVDDPCAKLLGTSREIDLRGVFT